VLDAAVFEVAGKKKKALLIRNPWHYNRYKGAVPNSQSVWGPRNGTFTMLFEEANDCFVIYSICKAEKDYHVTATELDAFSGSVVYQKVSTDKWWSLSVVWPNWRMFCQAPNPAYVLAVKNLHTGEVFLPTSTLSNAMNRISVEVPGTTNGKPAEYKIALSVHFTTQKHGLRIMLNKYHHKAAKFTKRRRKTPTDEGKAYSRAILDMLAGIGPNCKKVNTDGHSWTDWQKDTFVDGVPVLKSRDAKDGKKMFWDYKRVEWVVANTDKSGIAKASYKHYFSPYIRARNFTCV
jgi:hypothetical protein